MGKRKRRYLDTVVAFDIETTSYTTPDGERRAFPYTWCMQVDGEITIHRTEDSWVKHLQRLSEELALTDDRRLVIWVHNLAYEWAFIKHALDWEHDTVFCVGGPHRVIRAKTIDHIEFRCTYALTNASLAVVGEQVGVPKLKGDLDYDLPRHSETPLTAEEIGYIENDVKIITALIRYHNVRGLDNDTIPMTKTGFVRRTMRKATIFQEDKNAARLYRAGVSRLTLSPETYAAARAAFSGGYTHANATHAARTIEDVVAYDLGSSYPSSLTQFTYPMSSFARMSATPTLDNLDAMDNIHYICDITLHEVESNYNFPTISESKATSISYPRVDNGRVWAAESVRVTVTDVELGLIRQCYTIEDYTIHAVWTASKGYLPTPFITEILNFYRDKTTLKGVAGAEEQYRLAKENVNSVYGMTATDPVRESYFITPFDENLTISTEHPSDADLVEILDGVNKDRQRFLYYPWGAWCTAWSRYVLLSTIFDLEDAGVDVLYCDTDSIYAKAHPAIDTVIEQANDLISQRLSLAMEWHDLTPDTIAPLDASGTPRPLGLFECETPEPLTGFKTLGAKRYAKLDARGKFSITVAGLSKSAAKYVGSFEGFRPGLTVEAGKSGRMTHTYVEHDFIDSVTDYLGNVTRVYQWGGIHLAPSEYHLSVSADYLDFIESQR